MTPQEESDSPSPRKMSEMISEVAGHFIDFGKTTEDRQNRLIAACSAWNMSCGSPEMCRAQLEQYIEGYRRYNPATSSSDLAEIRSDMESLIERKLKLFPEDQRQIVDAKIVVIGEEYRIEVKSANLS